MKKTSSRTRRTPKATRKFSPTASKAGRRAKPKTAYDLLERVCEAITAHPLNYWQGYWKASRKHSDSCFVMDGLPHMLDVPENTCGTAFCRAGFIVAEYDGYNAPACDFDARARLLIGMPRRNRQIDHVSFLFDANAASGTPGTPEYAASGVAGLRAFMKQHAAHLKARLLKDVPHV